MPRAADNLRIIRGGDGGMNNPIIAVEVGGRRYSREYAIHQRWISDETGQGVTTSGLGRTMNKSA